MTLRIMAAVIALIAAPAEARDWTVDVEQSSIGFTASQMNAPIDGGFSDIEAEIVFDPNDIENASAMVRIPVSTADTKNSERDAAIRGTDWFDADNHPHATFVASSFARTGENAFDVSGALSIRGVEREVVWPMTIEIDDDRARASGEIEVDRRDWEIGQGEWSADTFIGYGVTIRVDLIASSE